MPDERIKDLAVHATEFASDDYIALDGTTNGTRNMTAANLLKLTAQNSLAGNLAPAYDNATGAVAGHLYMHEGKSWVCKENTSGDFDSSKFYELPVANVLPSKSVDEILTAESWIDGYGVVASSEQSFCPLGELWASQSQSATGYISLPSILDGKLSFLECVLAVRSLFGLCFYDSNKNVICGVPHPNQDYYGTKHRTVEIPVNAAFVRFSCKTTEKDNFFANVTSGIKLGVDDVNEKIGNQYKLINIASDVSFIDGKFVVVRSDVGPVGSVVDSTYQSATDFIKIQPPIMNGLLQYLNGVIPNSNIGGGLVFYDTDYNAICGVPEEAGSSIGVKENVVEIPNGAVYVRCTIPTAYKTDFFAHMMTRLYSDAKESQKDIEILNVMAGGELSPYSESLTIGDWTSDKIYRATSALIGTIGNSTYQSIIRVDLPDGLKRKLTYTRAKVTSPASSLAAGLVFFDKDGSAISGILHIADSSELSYEEYTTDVPRDATSVGFTMPTALLSVFAASINGTAVTYDNELGREVNELKKIIDSNHTGAEPSPQDCWNRFGIAVEEKCKFLGITGQRIFGPSGYGTVSWNTENDEQGRAYCPIYAVCKWMAASLQYEILSTVFSCDSYVIKPLGAEPAINISSSLKSSTYSSNLLDHYNILSWKGGTEGNVSVLEAVTVCVPSCDGAVFSAVIRKAGTDGEGDNRYLAMKVLLDIACAKYENRSANVSSLETELLATNVTNAMAILTPKGCGSAFLGRVDVTNSDYMLYNYGGTTSEICTMSTTKVLTAETVLDYITNLDEYVTVLSEDKDAAAGGTHPLFTVGEKVTYRQLLYALLILSSNEAGYILARCVGEKLLKTYRGNGFLPVE